MLSVMPMFWEGAESYLKKKKDPCEDVYKSHKKNYGGCKAGVVNLIYKRLVWLHVFIPTYQQARLISDWNGY